MLDVVLIFVIGLVVAGFVTTPFWSGRGSVTPEDPEVARLEAAREAKLREISDAEIDFRSGKMNREEFERIDAELRTEAVTILRELDQALSGEVDPNG
jgi:hypothetical protein